MTEDKGTQVAEQSKPKTEAELMAEMAKAMESKDFKLVAKISNEIVKVQKDKEATELAAKQKALEAITETVKGLFGAVGAMLTAGHKPSKTELDKLMTQLQAVKGTELDQADGIWYTNDFGEKLIACRLMKSQAKATRTGGGGGGKKFSVSTDELLVKFGNEPYKDGKTYKEAHDSNTDKNFRYNIREQLLKKGGYIT